MYRASSESVKMREHLKDGFGALFDLDQAFAQCSDVSGLEMLAATDAITTG